MRNARHGWLELALSPLVLLAVSCTLDVSGISPACIDNSQCAANQVCVAGVCSATDAGDRVDSGPMDSGPDRDGGPDAGPPVPDSGPGDGGPPLCANGVLDPGETDIDCGGPCPRCPGPRGVEDMILWLRADDLAMGAVGVWMDRSGAGNHFESAAGGVTQDPNVLNGHPAVRFTRNGQLATPNPVSLGGAAQISIIYVARSGTNPGVMMEASSNFRMNAGGFLDVRNSAGTGEFEVQHGTTGSGIVSWRTAQLDSDWHRLVSVRDAALTSDEARAYVDGALSGAISQNVDSAAPFQDYRWHLGDRDVSEGSGFQGDIAEVIAYARALTTEDVAHLDAYLTARYGP